MLKSKTTQNTVAFWSFPQKSILVVNYFQAHHMKLQTVYFPKLISAEGRIVFRFPLYIYRRSKFDKWSHPSKKNSSIVWNLVLWKQNWMNSNEFKWVHKICLSKKAYKLISVDFHIEDLNQKFCLFFKKKVLVCWSRGTMYFGEKSQE